MTGIPFELITMLGSTALGGLMKLWSQSQQYKAEEHKRQMELNALASGAVEKARDFVGPERSTGFHWTRRTIALLATFFIVCWPKIVPVFWPDMTVTAGYMDWNPGFWFLKDSGEAIKWVVTNGVTITPLDTNLMSAVIGLFMGSEVVKRR